MTDGAEPKTGAGASSGTGMKGRAPRAVICGYGEIATIGLQCLREAGYDTPLFVTHEDTPGETIWWEPPASWARSHGVTVATPDDVNRPGEVERIRALEPDFLFSLYYRSMIGPELLGVPRRGALNLHGSLLPRYRGRAPINWVLVNGETATGVTLHYMDAKPDHGDIVLQREVAIEMRDTGETLFRKIATQARLLLGEALPLLARGAAARRPQDHAQASYFGRRRPEDGRIDWSWPAPKVYNLIRAVTRPFPGAFTMLGGRRLYLWWGVPEERRAGEAGAAAGTILGPRAEGVAIAAGSGAVVVMKAQLEGQDEITGGTGLGALLPQGARLPS